MASESDARPPRYQATYLLRFVFLVAVYVAAARFGLGLQAVSGFAALVWPPSGIALAALLIFGNELSLAVLVGAFMVNVLTGAPFLVALSIGTGNALEALVGAYILRSIPGFRRSLDRVPDVLALVLLAAVASTMLSATIGVTSLKFARIISPGHVGETWRTWWLGDLDGDLIIAPLLLVWSTRLDTRPKARRVWEAIALGTCVIAASAFIFSQSRTSTSPFDSPYVLLTVLIWAALRFSQRGVVTAALFISSLAVWGSVSGHGPFARPALYDSLLALQLFMAVTAATFLLLGAAIAERQRTAGALSDTLAEQRHLYVTVAEANRTKSRFLAVMSHELRTPLNAIAGYVELIAAGIRGPVTSQQQEDLARIRRSQQRLLSVVNDILNFTKLEGGHVEYHFEPILLGSVLGSLDDLMRPQLEAKGLCYTIGDYDPHVLVRADREKLEQILLNLLSNAVKFTRAGGEIHLSCDLAEHHVTVSVRDTGRGIPFEKLERIFEPFVQVDQSLTTTQDGVGLGLAISRDLARAMDGELAVESEVGVGSTFSLRMPRVNAAAESA
jgi:signal transduction histidine kinase